MCSLEVYKIKDIQNFISLLVQFEKVGITDTKIIQDKIHKHLEVTSSIREPVIDSVTHNIRTAKSKLKKCPKCNKGNLSLVRNPDGLNIVGCSKCRYSEIVKEI